MSHLGAFFIWNRDSVPEYSLLSFISLDDDICRCLIVDSAYNNFFIGQVAEFSWSFKNWLDNGWEYYPLKC